MLDAWRVKFEQWDKNLGTPGRELTPPPRASVEDVPALIALFPEFGIHAATVLCESGPGVKEAALPLVVRYFGPSLAVRFSALDAHAPVEGRWPIDHRRERSAYVYFLREVGPDAYASAGDLLRLLALQIQHSEYGGGRYEPTFTLAKVFAGRTELLIEGLRDESAAVRQAATKALHLVGRDVALVGSTLAGMVDDEAPWVVVEAMTALCSRRWSTTALVEALRARVLAVDTGNPARNRLSDCLIVLTELAEEASQAEPGSK